MITENFKRKGYVIFNSSFAIHHLQFIIHIYSHHLLVQVHIWDGNTTREYLDKYGKHNIDTNDLGLAYGVQWRAAGAELGNIDTDYRGTGTFIHPLRVFILLLHKN